MKSGQKVEMNFIMLQLQPQQGLCRSIGLTTTTQPSYFPPRGGSIHSIPRLQLVVDRTTTHTVSSTAAAAATTARGRQQGRGYPRRQATGVKHHHAIAYSSGCGALPADSGREMHHQRVSSSNYPVALLRGCVPAGSFEIRLFCLCFSYQIYREKKTNDSCCCSCEIEDFVEFAHLSPAPRPYGSQNSCPTSRISCPPPPRPCPQSYPTRFEVLQRES